MADDPIWYHRVPAGFWTRSENRLAFMQWLERKLGIRRPEDWYDITVALVERYGGTGLMNRYYGASAIQMVKDYLPWYDWKDWMFIQAPKYFWDDFDNRRRYLEWLGEELGYGKPEDWYQVRRSDLESRYGGTLLAYYGSAPRLVMAHFPEYDWLPWRFRVVPKGFWGDPANVRWYLEWLGEKLGFTEPEDWYAVKVRDLWENHGGTVAINFKGAAAAVMKHLYPEYEWHPWKFAMISPRNFWNDPANVRRYLEWLGEELGYEDFEDWYGIQAHDISLHFGSTLLANHGHSPSAVVMAGFPEHDWHEWRFRILPNFFWDDPANVRRYLEWLGEELGFRTQKDWYRLTVDDVKTHRGSGLLIRHHHSPARIMSLYFPEHEWDEWEFRRPVRSMWDDPDFGRAYLEKLGKRLGFKEPEDWYRVKFMDFVSYQGSSMTNRFNSSPVAILRTYMPEYDWKEWLFKTPPVRWWTDREARRRYLDWLAEKLGIRSAEDWGRLRCKHFIKNRGNGLVKNYEWSVRDVLVDTFPRDHPAVRGILAVEDRKRLPRKS